MSGPFRRLLLAWLALLVMLGLTLAAALLPLGSLKPWIGYGIAAAKAGTIAWIFMNMRGEGGLLRLATGATVLWVVFLLCLTAADYLTRDLAIPS